VRRTVRGLVVKTGGVADALRAALAPLAERVQLAFVYGSVAKGQERRASDVNVMVIGEVSFAEASEALGARRNQSGARSTRRFTRPRTFARNS
jgi:predicted nucleotidyltransferase